MPTLSRWRLQTLASVAAGAVTLVALICLLGSYLAFGDLVRGDQVIVARQEATEVAHSLGAQLASGLDQHRLQAQQHFFEDEQITVITRRGTFRIGVRPPGPIASYLLSTPAGQVHVISPIESEHGLPLKLTGISAGTLLMVGLVATGAVWVGTGRLRRTVERASAAAGRVSAGDLTARVGRQGPAELAQLGTAFDAMTARLAALDSEQRQFLADVSHEIATPFHTVSGLAQALLDGTIDPSTDDAPVREVVAQETARLSRLLHDLRELTQPELEPAVVRVDVGVAVRRLTDRFAGMAAAKQLTVTVHAPHLRVVTDPHLLEIIASNLLTNALRYTPRSGRISVRVGRDRRGVVVSFTDTGPGIPLGEQERIFDRFYRVDRARDRASGGSGLGLAIARRYAQALGGRIELESTPGQGSRFSLVLPAAASAAAPSADKTPQTAISG